jgi:hypothetical protein
MSACTLVKLAAPIAGLTASMLFHSVHNLGASLAAVSCWTICLSFIFDWGGILMLAVLIALVWRQEKSWMTKNLPGEARIRTLRGISNATGKTWPGWGRHRLAK